MRRVLVAIALAAIGLVPMPATAQTTPTCFGQAVTILGTLDDDELNGTTGMDVMHGLAKDDDLRGDRRRDYVCGGGGDDVLDGGSSGDTMDGGSGADVLLSDGAGGVEGNDVALGGDGDDVFRADRGEDVMRRGLGNDRFVNMAEGSSDFDTKGDDVIHGGPGNDVMWGRLAGGHHDSYYGDEGDDKLDSTAIGHEPPGEADLVDGGDGFDQCEVDEDDTVLNCEEVWTGDEIYANWPANDKPHP